MKIECNKVSFKYDIPGDEWALRDIDFTIAQGEKIAIVGPAGSGKTTLIQLLDGLILPTQGDVFIDGKSIKKLAKARDLPSIRRRIGVLFQFPEQQFFQETAYDELAFALRNFMKPDESELSERARAVVGPFGMNIEVLRQASPFQLSSGEKRRLALASSLMTRPEVLMLDEPTAGMDASGRAEVVRMISSLKDTTVLLVTHNLEDFMTIIDRVIGISQAKKVVDIRLPDIIDNLDRLEEVGITPPLVLKVQQWLKQSGMKCDRVYYRMQDLIEFFKSNTHVKSSGDLR